MYNYAQLQTLSKTELINLVMESNIGPIAQPFGACKFFADFSGLIKNWNKEHFVVLCLNTRHTVLHAEVVSMGTLDASLVHPREVFNIVLATPGTKSIIIGHNHPSGDPEPSDSDFNVTNNLVKACQIMGIELIDHIVFTKSGRFYSFSEQDKL